MSKQLTAREQAIETGTQIQHMEDNITVKVTAVHRDEESGLIEHLWVQEPGSDEYQVRADAFREWVIL